MDKFNATCWIIMAILHTVYCSTSASCADSCVGKTNGNYQLCQDCHQYMACSNGYKYLIPCPANLVWDDATKRCEWTSATCNIHTNNNTTGKTMTGCDDSCIGKTIGNYHYCRDCHQYMSCNKQCEWASSTCNTHTKNTTKTATLVENDTTRYTSTTAGPVTTEAAETSSTAKPTSATNCIQEKLIISLERGDPIVTGNSSFISVLDGINGNARFGCNANLLLKATFQRSIIRSSVLGCNEPHFGNKMLKIDMMVSSIINGVSFHVGQEEIMDQNSAELYCLGYKCMLHSGSKCVSFAKDFTGLLNVNVSRVTFYISNEFIRVTNNLGYTFDLCSSCLFALNGQPDSMGSKNEELYIGINRSIYSSNNRKGTGVCGAEISWTCS